MNKIPLFLDADETMLNSIPAFVSVYNERYSQQADYTKLQQYDFKDICPLLKQGEVQDIFKSDRFWELLTLKDGCFNVLNKQINLDTFEYILVTIGNPKNLYKKSKFVIEHLPMISEIISLTHKNNEMNKCRVNMQGEHSVFIDDHKDNLISSNATYKICFKEKWYPWNHNWYGSTVSNWNELDGVLDTIRNISVGDYKS